MDKWYFILIVLLLASTTSQAQSYTSYRTGATNDSLVSPAGGVCLMGGATESDEAMQWFLRRANGGDVLVLRATGGNGYNNYFYQTLGVNIHSVETLVFHQASAAFDAYVLQRVAEAEAIWIAGGDQWDYVQYWRGTPVDSLINEGLQQRHLVLGGTSAGMAIQGEVYFSAQNGTVTSSTALANPYDASVQVDTTAFINNHFLEEVIMDTHYDNPSREGRQLTFMARMLQDYGVAAAKGIACDEYTAVCIDTSGIARVFGDAPTYDDNAYFLQVNCALANPLPEQCQAGSPLVWDHNGQAVLVYRVQGTRAGNNSFDLQDWRSATGGTWQYWSINSSGVLSKGAASAPTCGILSTFSPANASARLYPNPCHDQLHLEALDIQEVQVVNALGQVLWQQTGTFGNTCTLPTDQLAKGCYWARWQSGAGWSSRLFVKQ